MRFAGWWIGFALLLLATQGLDLYLGLFLLTLIVAAFSLRRRNKFLWRVSQALGPEPYEIRLVATLLLFLLGAVATALGLWLSPALPGRLLLAAGYAAWAKVVVNLLANHQERYMKRRF